MVSKQQHLLVGELEPGGASTGAVIDAREHDDTATVDRRIEKICPLAHPMRTVTSDQRHPNRTIVTTLARSFPAAGRVLDQRRASHSSNSVATIRSS